MITNTDRCTRCTHTAWTHRKDDADPTPITSPSARFRCVGEELLLSCAVACPDFVAPGGE